MSTTRGLHYGRDWYEPDCARLSVIQYADGEGRILKKVHPNAYDAVLDDGEGTTYDSDGNNIRIHYPDGGWLEAEK